jgi:2'-phosphotransferase
LEDDRYALLRGYDSETFVNLPTIAEKEGLSKMKRNHIHLAQAVSTTNAISGTHSLPLSLPPGTHIIAGLRKSAHILIYIDIPKALSSGLQFFLSDNGVVLTEGDDRGYLKPDFFLRVENIKREAFPGWEGVGSIGTKSFESGRASGPKDIIVRKEDAIPVETAMEDLTVTERVESE